MLKSTKSQLDTHRAMANVYLRAADAYKATGNRAMYVAKMSQYEKEMREVLKSQIALAKVGA